MDHLSQKPQAFLSLGDWALSIGTAVVLLIIVGILPHAH
jgi:hypothetical protein